MTDLVVLVDKKDRKTGVGDKLEAHQGNGKLHRAISVLLWRNGMNGREVLLQQRAAQKLLWPLYWTNTVCTHPGDGEDIFACAVRRLAEEMGIEMHTDNLRYIYRSYYQVHYTDALSEFELSNILIGKWDGTPVLNREEAKDYRWIPISKLITEVKQNPLHYTPWFLKLISDQRVIKEITFDKTGKL